MTKPTVVSHAAKRITSISILNIRHHFTHLMPIWEMLSSNAWGEHAGVRFGQGEQREQREQREVRLGLLPSSALRLQRARPQAVLFVGSFSCRLQLEVKGQFRKAPFYTLFGGQTRILDKAHFPDQLFARGIGKVIPEVLVPYGSQP